MISHLIKRGLVVSTIIRAENEEDL